MSSSEIHSDLDPKILDLARQIHRKIIADYTFHGRIGGSLSVYLIDKLPGIPYIEAIIDGTMLEQGSQHSNTVTDYALYVRSL